jgi:hypothetical protein
MMFNKWQMQDRIVHKMLWVLAVLALCFAPVQGQVNMGARLGLNMSTVTHSSVDVGVTRMAVGPGGGFVLHVPLTDIFALQTELLFNSKGIAASATLEGISQRASKRIYYLDVPFIVRAYYRTDKLRIFGGTGPQLGLGLFVQDITRTSGEHFRNKFSETSGFSPQTRRYEIAWDFESGIAIPLKDHSEIEFGIRPSLGLINIAKEKFNRDNNRNFLVAFSAAYLFGR